MLRLLQPKSASTQAAPGTTRADSPAEVDEGLEEAHGTDDYDYDYDADGSVRGNAWIRKQLLRHADALYTLARYMTAHSGDAEDLVQETFIRALQAVPSPRTEPHLKAWLFRILRNSYFDSHRKQKKHQLLDQFDDELNVPESLLRGDSELELLRASVASEIEAALAKLSVESRTVLLLDLEGFTEGEIAEIMTCPLGTVKSRLMRARMHLRKQLCHYAT